MKKNGFTLIELLAVIVILAIIALIATPIILGIINDARVESQERSAELYLSAVDLAVVKRNMTEEFSPEECTITEGVVTCTGYEDPLNVEIDGETPKSGTILFANNKVSNGTTLIFEGFEATIEEGKIKVGSVSQETPEGGENTDEICTRQNDAEGFDTVTCGTESFYVIHAGLNEETGKDEITMLSKYNLNAGYSYVDNIWNTTLLENPTGKQSTSNEECITGQSTSASCYGVSGFATSQYWSTSDFSAYVYGNYEGNLMYQYVNEYERILKEDLGVSSAKAGLISYEQLLNLGCSYDPDDVFKTTTCPETLTWLNTTTYYTGSVRFGNDMFKISKGYKEVSYGGFDQPMGIRPILTISASEIG